MRGFEYIQSRQILWAKRNGLTLVGSKGERGLPIYTQTLEENLYEALTPENMTQFEAGDGGEVHDKADGPAKMKALHSSSAIAVNIFQYWSKIEKVPQIAHACGLCMASNHGSEKICFEKKYPIDAAFQYPPNIDVVIENSKSTQYKVFAVECKFSEAYRSRKHDGIKPKYLGLEDLWKDIPEIHKLAKRISPEDQYFKHLHPAQLIKHILGLKKEYGSKRAFRLLYLWYDVHGEESYTHRQEIEKFKEIAKADGIKFSAHSYQRLITKLAKDYYEGNEKYIHYISDRYL